MDKTPNLLELEAPKDLITINEFFKGQDVFITGATGFIGKVLVEKLLRSCPDVGTLYLLARPKKGVTMEQRIRQLCDLPLFDRLKAENPSSLSKIVAITGYMELPGLGLHDQVRAQLARCGVVLHAAATVRFNEPIRRAVDINVRATRDILEIAKTMESIKAFVYVSTAYSNCGQDVVEERVYTDDICGSWRNVLRWCESLDDAALQILTPKLKGKHPNTYTYSKHLAESLIYDYRHELPVSIYRPSIVSFTINEPMPGWVDSIYGPMAPSLGILSGVLHAMYGNSNARNDFIPCDFAVNGLIATAWYRGVTKGNDCLVFNAVSGDNLTTTASMLAENTVHLIYEFPLERVLWYPTFLITDWRPVYEVMVWLTHLLPAVLVDPILKFKNIDFSLMKLYRKIYHMTDETSYFSINEWNFIADKFVALARVLTPADRQDFPFDLSTVDHVPAIRTGLIGVKKYFLKEVGDEESDRKRRIHMTRLYYVDRIFRGSIFLALGWFLFSWLYRFISSFM